MTGPRWLDETEMRAWMAFLETSHLLQRRIDQQLREAGGVTQPQYELLTRLAEAPDRRRRMSELADLLVTGKSRVTYQVTQLERLGLVRRTACEDDERGVVAELTDDGREMLRRAAPGHVEVVRDGLVDALSRDQLVALADILETARARLRG